MKNLFMFISKGNYNRIQGMKKNEVEKVHLEIHDFIRLRESIKKL
jgi:hypothetical protein